jgi:Mce-associated membrane protein
VTLIEAVPRAATASEDTAPAVPASWPTRAGALCLDVLPGAAVLATTAPLTLSVPLRGGWWWVCVSIGAAAVLWTGFSRLLMPGASGQSLGRLTFGTAVVRRDGRRRAAAIALTAGSLCALEAAVSYTVVHQQDRSIADASVEIAAQGPRIVQQILSYHPETVQSDFARARSLTTDTYRGQLAAQQQAVQKAGLVRNEYWVTNSSVLSAMQGRATMLLFLQGQRGVAPNQRYITASVRVTFVESGSAPWRVDDLAVVTDPPPVGGKP